MSLAILNESRVTISCCSEVTTLARRVTVSYSADVSATVAGAGGDTGVGGDTGGSVGESDLDLLRDDDGNSDVGGKDGDVTGGGNGISYPGQRKNKNGR
ncbi:hypothetical protein Tco_0158757 [Tanacetum coccineum]